MVEKGRGGEEGKGTGRAIQLYTVCTGVKNARSLSFYFPLVYLYLSDQCDVEGAAYQARKKPLRAEGSAFLVRALSLFPKGK